MTAKTGMIVETANTTSLGNAVHFPTITVLRRSNIFNIDRKMKR